MEVKVINKPSFCVIGKLGQDSSDSCTQESYGEAFNYVLNEYLPEKGYMKKPFLKQSKESWL